MMKLINYIKKDEKWINKSTTLNDRARKFYTTTLKYLYELVDVNLFKKIESFDYGYDDQRCVGFIYICIDIYNKNNGGRENVQIDFYIERINNDEEIEYSDIIISPYLTEDEEYEPFPWFRTMEFLKKANTLEELNHIIREYLNSDEYQKEKYPY
jgi:hypothetical protein